MNRRPMPPAVRSRIAHDLAESKRRREDSSRGDVWQPLEEAHILSQPWAWTHVRVHAAMLSCAVSRRDGHETLGQLVRLVVAGPGSLTGRYPVGNTGRAAVPALQPMPMPQDLATLLGDGVTPG